MNQAQLVPTPLRPRPRAASLTPLPPWDRRGTAPHVVRCFRFRVVSTCHSLVVGALSLSVSLFDEAAIADPLW